MSKPTWTLILETILFCFNFEFYIFSPFLKLLALRANLYAFIVAKGAFSCAPVYIKIKFYQKIKEVNCLLFRNNI